MVLKVAMLCPLDDKLYEKNAADAAEGWDLWLKATNGTVKLGKTGADVKIETTTVSYKKNSFLAAAQKVSTGNYHLVVGCSTHYYKEVLAAMQALKVPNLQCNAGNPDIWWGISQVAEKAQEPVYGFGLHAPFTSYPQPFFEMAKSAYESEKLSDRPLKVALVRGSTPNQFTDHLCDAAMKAAHDLKMTVVGDRFHSVKDARDSHGITAEADVLYACTLLNDGEMLMHNIEKSGTTPRALSITVAPSKPHFAAVFGEQADYVSYPAQWHHLSNFECSGECPPDLASAKDFVNFNGGVPSYDRASCTAAGVALEAAVSALGVDFLTASLEDQRTLLLGALSGVDKESFFGRIKFDKETHMNTGHKAVITQYQPHIKDDGSVLVEPHPVVVDVDSFKLAPAKKAEKNSEQDEIAATEKKEKAERSRAPSSQTVLAVAASVYAFSICSP